MSVTVCRSPTPNPASVRSRGYRVKVRIRNSQLMMIDGAYGGVGIKFVATPGLVWELNVLLEEPFHSGHRRAPPKVVYRTASSSKLKRFCWLVVCLMSSSRTKAVGVA